MRFVYVDEAGTGQHEPVTIVAAAILSADRQLNQAERLLVEALNGVPAELRDGFVFSAKNVFANQAYQDRWRLTDRVNLITRIAAIPRKLNGAVAFGHIRRESEVPDWWPDRPEFWHHLLAFDQCMCRSDKYIRENGFADEIGSVVAEDDPKMRKHLKGVIKKIKEQPFIAPKGGLIPREIDLKQGFNSQDGESRVERLRSAIQFVEKEDDPLVMIADAVAFSLRRFFSEQDLGDLLAQSAFGQLPSLHDFRGPGSGGLFRFN
ncbi:MAG: DUF3800 domain-containing protein [Pseudomonadota bacterium]